MQAFAEEKPGRQRDDETQAYLIEWFRSVAGREGFTGVFEALTEDEKAKLRAYG
jgi:hypothetical protein